MCDSIVLSGMFMSVHSPPPHTHLFLPLPTPTSSPTPHGEEAWQHTQMCSGITTSNVSGSNLGLLSIKQEFYTVLYCVSSSLTGFILREVTLLLLRECFWFFFHLLPDQRVFSWWRTIIQQVGTFKLTQVQFPKFNMMDSLSAVPGVSPELNWVWSSK